MSLHSAAPGCPAERPLTPRQEEAALVLARGGTVEEAAHRSGAGKRTVKLWTATVPAFPRRVSALRAEMTARALGRLAREMAGAAATLGYLTRHGKSEMVRLSAARAVLEMGTRLRELVEVEERLARLETRLTPKAGRRTA